jgi:hypothetical protein
VAEHDHAGLHGRPQVLHELAHEGNELVLVDGQDASSLVREAHCLRAAIVCRGRPVPHREDDPILGAGGYLVAAAAHLADCACRWPPVAVRRYR